MTTFWVETGYSCFLGTYIIIGCKKRNFDTHIVRIWCCRMHEHCCESSGPADAQGATLLPFYLWCHVQIPCGCNVNTGDPFYLIVIRFVALIAAFWFTVKDCLQVASCDQWDSANLNLNESEHEEYTVTYGQFNRENWWHVFFVGMFTLFSDNPAFG